MPHCPLRAAVLLWSFLWVMGITVGSGSPETSLLSSIFHSLLESAVLGPLCFLCFTKYHTLLIMLHALSYRILLFLTRATSPLFLHDSILYVEGGVTRQGVEVWGVNDTHTADLGIDHCGLLSLLGSVTTV